MQGAPQGIFAQAYFPYVVAKIPTKQRSQMNEIGSFGAQVEQVDEPPATFVFELEAFPEAKSLSTKELEALYSCLKSFYKVADLIGSSETFARQNHKPHQLNRLSKPSTSSKASFCSSRSP